MERFLVTGCAGFIGSNVLDRLVDMGYEVTGIDDLSTGNRANMDVSKGKFRFVEGSMCDADAVADALQNVDLVIHLATVPSVPRSVANPMESAHASVLGTVTLLNEARKTNVRRIVQASSSSIYGDSNVMPRIETSMPSPMSPYAAAKLSQEQYALAFFKCFGIDTASLRYFNVFGPRQNPDSQYAAVIPKFIKLMRAGTAPTIYGDGTQTRDFTYVENVVDANIKAALCPKPLRGEAMNIGCGETHSLNDLVKRLNQLLGTNLMPEYTEKRVGDVYESQADITKAQMMFGYKPMVTFPAGLEKMVNR